MPQKIVEAAREHMPELLSGQESELSLPKGVALQGPVAQWVGQVRGSNQFRLSVDIDPQSFY